VYVIRGIAVNAQLADQVERWEKFWRTVTDAAEVDRQLWKLRWLEEFAFHCGPGAVDREQFAALTLQIENGEKKLAELSGIDVPKTSVLRRPQVVDSVRPELARNSVSETYDSGTTEALA